MKRGRIKFSLKIIGLIQALGLVGYCSLVALVFWRGNEWFGKMSDYWGPVLVLSLLVVSALISALIALGYPAILIWKKKEAEKAVKLAGYTAGWLLGLVLMGMGIAWWRK